MSSSTITISVEEFNALQSELHKARAAHYDAAHTTAKPSEAEATHKKDSAIGKLNVGAMKKKMNFGFGHKSDKDKEKDKPPTGAAGSAVLDDRDDRASDEGRLSVDRREELHEELRQYQLQVSELQKAYREAETRNIELREQLKQQAHAAKLAAEEHQDQPHAPPPPPEIVQDPKLLEELTALREELASTKAKLQDQEVELAKLRELSAAPARPAGSPVASGSEDVDALRKQLTAMQIQRETRENELERLRNANGEMKGKMDKLQREHTLELQRLRGQVEDAQAQQRKAEAEAKGMAQKLSAMSSQEMEEIQRLSTQLLAVVAERDDQLGKVGALQAQIEATARQQQESAKAAAADTERRVAEANARADHEKAERTKAQSLLEELRRAHQSVSEQHDRLTGSLGQAESELVAAKARLVALEAERESERREAAERERASVEGYLRDAVVGSAIADAVLGSAERRLKSLASAASDRDAARREAEELRERVERLQQGLREAEQRSQSREQDQEAEYRIRLKKSQQLIKELQLQLGAGNAAANGGVGGGGGGPPGDSRHLGIGGPPPLTAYEDQTVYRVGSAGSLSESHSPRVEVLAQQNGGNSGLHTRSGSFASDDLTHRVPSVSGTGDEETIHLIRANTQLQQRIWQLEGQVATLRIDLQHMKGDVEKKSGIIASYVSEKTMTKAAASAAPKTGLKAVAVKMRPKGLAQMLKSKAGTQMKENMQHIVEEALAHCLELEKENDRLREALSQYQPLEETA